MTLDGYFDGAIAHLEARGQLMLASIPADLPRDYDALSTTLEHHIRASLNELAKLRTDTALRTPENLRVRLRTFKREVANLEHLERSALAALSRALPPDNHMNRLVDGIKRETGFPFVAPIVSPFSGNHYSTDILLKIISVPLLEGSFVLHLPDLYHELGHHLLTGMSNPKLEPLYEQCLMSGGDIDEHFRNAARQASLGFSPKAHLPLLRIYRSSWIQYWLVEFYCDVFAAACLGPAYGWAHLLLTLKQAPDPFVTPASRPTTHPPDHARMQVILDVLNTTGHTAATKRMSALWDQLMQAQNHTREAEFDLALPDSLRDAVVDHALKGFREIGCVYGRAGQLPPIARILNEAWDAFLASPDQFAKSEAQFTARLSAVSA